MAEHGEHSEPGTASGSSRPDLSWFPQPDPVESFGNTVEQALRQLSIELAGLRAERDGLRLELEGIRTQYELLRQQLADRDRFTQTVRELSDIVRHLTMPTRWAGDPVAAQHLEQPATPTWTPPPAAYPPPPAPSPFAPPPPATPVTPPAPAPAPAPQPEPAAFTPPATPQPGPAPATPAPQPEPTATFVAGPSGTDAAPAAPVSPEPEPEQPVAEEPAAPPPPDPRPEPPFFEGQKVESASWDPIVVVDTDPTGETPKATRRQKERSPEVERFFDQPGVWLGEPEKGDKRRDRLRTWGSRLATVALAIVVLGVLIISVGPRVLPYQTFFVRSGSMEPTIQTGSMIFLTKVDASDLEKGDIITFERPDKPGTMVTHRILTIETTDAGRFFQTKGDANGTPDSWRVPASGTGWKYAFNIPKVGFVFGYLGTNQARLALLAIPAVLLGLLSLIDIWRPAGGTPTAPRRRR